MEEKDAEDVEMDPSQARTRHMGVAHWGNSTSRDEGHELDVDEEVDTISSSGDPGNGSHTSRGATPVPDSPLLSALVPLIAPVF